MILEVIDKGTLEISIEPAGLCCWFWENNLDL